jgi:hypothetical protein
MKRISLPLFAVLVFGVAVSGQVIRYTYPQMVLKDRSPASVGDSAFTVSNIYGKVFDAWTNIPSVCKEDFPLTEFQKTECDGFWRTFLTRMVVAGFPFFVAFILFQAWAHVVKRSYQRAASRVARRKVTAIGEVITEASFDTYSWALGLRPFRVKTGDQIVTAYLEKHAEPGQTVHLYEAGHWFGRMKHVAVKAA